MSNKVNTINNESDAVPFDRKRAMMKFRLTYVPMILYIIFFLMIPAYNISNGFQDAVKNRKYGEGKIVLVKTYDRVRSFGIKTDDKKVFFRCYAKVTTGKKHHCTRKLDYYDQAKKYEGRLARAVWFELPISFLKPDRIVLLYLEIDGEVVVDESKIMERLKRGVDDIYFIVKFAIGTLILYIAIFEHALRRS